MPRFVVLCSLLLLLLSMSSGARAEEDALHSASARALFEEGVKLADAGQWNDAAERFQRALSLRDSQVIRYNLAAALVELGRVVEASEMLRQVQRGAGDDPELRTQAEQQLALANSRLARLTIRVEGELGGREVSLDGRTLSSALVGVAIPVDPGSHAVKLLAGDTELDAQSVQLPDGASTAITLSGELVPTPQQAARSMVAEQPAPVMHDEPAPEQRSKRRLWWGIGGAAVVVISAAVVGAVLASNKSASPSAFQGNFEPGSIPVEVTP